MKIKQAIIIVLSIAITSCMPPKAPAPMSGANISLAEASYDVSRSISSLSETAQAAHPLPKLEAPPNPASYGMGELTSIDWSGPVEPLVRQIAKAANYRVRILGTPPAIPVLVTIYDKNRMLADVLRDVGYQCGRRANIVIFPESNVIELQYAKN